LIIEGLSRLLFAPMNTRDFARRHKVALLVALVTLAARPTMAIADERLPRYPELAPKVAFWTDVFTKHTSRQMVFHDPVLLDVVWEVHDVSSLVDGDMGSTQKARAIRDYQARAIELLAERIRRLEQAAPQTDAERRVAAVLAKHAGKLPSHAELAARVRVQRGLGDKLCDSYRRASAYLPQMRPLLAKHGVPEELAYLPLVESGYNIGAHSHKGAVGIYQFTRGTGRRYLHIDNAVDERRDPLLATEAAAKYLRSNYDQLGSWPLAITAYNHGEHGVGYAVRKLGTTNLPTIIANYDGRSFGFASKNFYAEFLAAVDSMAIARSRCSVDGVQPLDRDSVPVRAYVPLRKLASTAGLDVATLAELNPALTSDVVRGRLHVPRGYSLYLPRGKGPSFETALASLPADAKSEVQAVVQGTHTVRAGQTLSEIAAEYRTSVSALLRTNGMKDPRRLRVGQRLKVPVVGGSGAVVTAAADSPVEQGRVPSSTSVRVARGETLSHIAARHGVSVADLMRYNGISKASAIRAGQVLRIPARRGTGGVKTHRVGRGQTLSDIADIYRTSVGNLQRHNQINDPSKLRYGQVIEVPM
jgi:membrane-bound lytic murein transglycosylase D